jgi:hypothetical protein
LFRNVGEAVLDEFIAVARRVFVVILWSEIPLLDNCEFGIIVKVADIGRKRCSVPLTRQHEERSGQPTHHLQRGGAVVMGMVPVSAHLMVFPQVVVVI